jgi:hypothetical protein
MLDYDKSFDKYKDYKDIVNSLWEGFELSSDEKLSPDKLETFKRDNKKTFRDKFRKIGMRLSGISEKEFDLIKKLETLNNSINSRIIQNSILDTHIEVAKILKGLDLYYSVKLDYRLRIYTQEYLFNRCSGLYKWFLSDKNNIKLSFKGLKNMLFNYFNCFPLMQREIKGLRSFEKTMEF